MKGATLPKHFKSYHEVLQDSFMEIHVWTSDIEYRDAKP